jgi:hypothetical protein
MSNIVAMPSQRGYSVVYRVGEINHCPGCSRVNWYIGRVTAECAFCSTALPLVDMPTSRAGMFTRNNRHTPTAYRGRFTVNGRAA